MTVLVTGATGRLGQAVVARLLAEGQQVTVLTRRPFRARELFGDRVTSVEWHPLSDGIPPEALAGATGIVHLMGEPVAGYPLRDRRAIALESRLNAARRLTEAVAGSAIRIVAASLAIAAAAGAAGTITEASPANPSPSALERDILAWEAAVAAAAEGGASVANVRLGLLAAPGPPLDQLLALARVGLAVDLRGVLIPAIDIADAAAMLTGLLSRSDLTGVIYGVAPEPVKGEDLARLLAKAARFQFPVRLPRAVLRRRLGAVTAFIEGRQRIVPQRLIDLGAEFTAPDPLPSLERAIAELTHSAPQPDPFRRHVRRLFPARPSNGA